jgi:hypothetical protein
MSSPAVPARFPALSGRALAAFAVLSAALVAAFVVAPPTLAGIGSGGGLGDETRLGAAFREAFVGYWSSGARDLSPDLTRIVDYWFEFHVVKGVVAVILLGVFAVAGVRLGKAFVGAGGGRKRIALAASGVLAAMLGVVSLAAVMANVQGAVTPFASLFPLLVDGATAGGSADALEQARQQLAASPGAGGYPPALDVMVSDFGRYHVAMVVIASIVAVVLVGAGVVAWTRSARSSDRRARRVLGLFSVFSVLLSLAAIVLVVANAGVAADPAPALAALFDGGW